MSVLFILIPTALLLGAGAVLAFIWSARSGQLDDLETPAVRILLEDPPSRQHSPDLRDSHPAGRSTTPGTGTSE